MRKINYNKIIFGRNMFKLVKNKIKKYINNLISYDKEIKLLYTLPGYKRHIDEIIADYESKLMGIQCSNQKEKITIVFICQVPALWNGMKSVYEAARKHPMVKEFLVAIPEKKLGESFDIDHDIYDYNFAYDFCRNEIDVNTINGYDNKTFFDIKKLNPTYVFLPRPYDDHLPNCYRSYVINSYAKVCYIPYGYTICKWDSRTGYSLDFICNAYAIFTENEYYQRVLNNIFRICKCSSKQIYQFGYPRFDLYKNEKHIVDCEHKKTVLWMPRWTTDKSFEATTFFQYKDVIVDFFVSRRNLKIICRPHPLMLRNFVSCGLMSETEVNEFLDLFSTYSNFEYDDSGDYTKSLCRADIIISDFSSLIVEEMVMGVPIIYTGQIKNFEPYMKKLAKCVYTTYNTKELIDILEKLIVGDDPLAIEREKTKNLLLVNGYECGKHMIDALVEDALN